MPFMPLLIFGRSLCTSATRSWETRRLAPPSVAPLRLSSRSPRPGAAESAPAVVFPPCRAPPYVVREVADQSSRKGGPIVLNHLP